MSTTYKKQKVIIIVGPTASGKSDLGISIAKKFKGEIISADSRQVYQRMKIGTAQVKGVWKNGIFISERIPHYGIDFVPPTKVYTAAEFKKYASDAIQKISSAGKVPIVAGGTGFWVDSLVYDFDLPHVEPNWKLREKLEKKSVTRLLAMLTVLDPKRAIHIEKKNPRRLIRAIEIAQALGRVPLLTKKRPYRTCWIGISASQETLKRRIEARARTMIRKGLIAETKKLMIRGVTK
ncbi:MAG: tRNA (adenosine(37)-N6)-dimethylallyltransferase MiaA, partial [Candidatus Sungbacteria bacterium]|nr:tRNA (adenosine(37)-N6)-dimethylallyltransferase MiaA [Candidatus Sungbacteria bacterium]